jgi:hypothetical protein
MEKLSFLRNPYHKKTIFSEKHRGREVSENIPLDIYPRIEHELFNNRIQSVLADFDYCSRKYEFEIYHPLLDKRIVEFCTTVPPIEFIKDGWERSLIRRSMNGIVPETVRWRKYKCYFNIPYINYIINGISVFEKILSKKSSMAWEYFDSKQIKVYLDLLRYSPRDIAYPEYLCRTLGRVANIASFIIWNEEN